MDLPKLEAYQDSYGRFGYRYVDGEGKPITNTPASPIANPVDPTQNTADKQSANSEAAPINPTAAAPTPSTPKAPTPGVADKPTDNGSASGADMAPEEAQTIGDFLGALGTVASFGLAALGGPLGMAAAAIGLGLSVANNKQSSLLGEVKEAIGFGKAANKGEFADVGKGYQSTLGANPVDPDTPSFDTKSFDAPTMQGYTPDLGSIPDVAMMESEQFGGLSVHNLDAQNTLDAGKNVSSTYSPDPANIGDPTDGVGPGGPGSNTGPGAASDTGANTGDQFASGGLVQRNNNMTMGSGGLANPGALNMSGGGLVNQPGATRPYHLMDGLQRMATGGLATPPAPVEAPAAPTSEADVADEVPAKLTDGEFVFDVDTVRFYGLDKLLKMRQKAQEAMSAQRGEPMQAETPQEAMLPPSPEGVASPPMQMADGGEVRKKSEQDELADRIMDMHDKHEKGGRSYSLSEQQRFDATVRGMLAADDFIKQTRKDVRGESDNSYREGLSNRERPKNYAEGGLVERRKSKEEEHADRVVDIYERIKRDTFGGNDSVSNRMRQDPAYEQEMFDAAVRGAINADNVAREIDKDVKSGTHRKEGYR